MADWSWILALLCLVLLAGLVLERVMAQKARRRLKHVIHVNGTRGKSSVARLIDAGLREGGLRVFCKTTGTLPMVINTLGQERQIRRFAPANIREQLETLFQAARENADVLVAECMAISPELQQVSAAQMLRPDITVITNVRLDHTDVLGDSLEEIGQGLLRCLFPCSKGCNALAFTGDPAFFPSFAERCKALGIAPQLAEPLQSELDFPENLGLALSVCQTLGVHRETALRGMERVRRDPYAAQLYEREGRYFLNGFSTNEPQSAVETYRRFQRERGFSGPLTLIINCREDRPERTRQMVELAAALAPSLIVLLGDMRPYLGRRLRQRLPGCEICCPKRPEEVPLWSTPTAYGVGNIKGMGIRLLARVTQEAKCTMN